MGFQDGVERRRWGTRMDSGGAAAFISFVHRFRDERATSAYRVYHQQVTGYMSTSSVALFAQNAGRVRPRVSCPANALAQLGRLSSVGDVSRGASVSS